MPIRRGEEFLESLRDGRRVWVRGELVEDVTAHPSLKGCARSVAAVYDLQHVPAHRDLLTMPSPVTAQPVSLAYLLPHSVEDLTRQRKMYEFLVRRAGGLSGRGGIGQVCPDDRRGCSQSAHRPARFLSRRLGATRSRLGGSRPQSEQRRVGASRGGGDRLGSAGTSSGVRR